MTISSAKRLLIVSICALLLIQYPTEVSGAVVKTSLSPFYYKITKDVRTCAPPACGGYYIFQLNSGNKTTCLNGTIISGLVGCYVAGFHYNLTTFTDAQKLAFQAKMLDGGIDYGRQVLGSNSFPYLQLLDPGWDEIGPEDLGGPICTCNKTTEICIYDRRITCTGCSCPTVCITRPQPRYCLDIGPCPQPGGVCGGPYGYTCETGLTCVSRVEDVCGVACGIYGCWGTCALPSTIPA